MQTGFDNWGWKQLVESCSLWATPFRRTEIGRAFAERLGLSQQSPPFRSKGCILDFARNRPWTDTLMVYNNPIFCILDAPKSNLYSTNGVTVKSPGRADFRALAEASFI